MSFFTVRVSSRRSLSVCPITSTAKRSTKASIGLSIRRGARFSTLTPRACSKSDLLKASSIPAFVSGRQQRTKLACRRFVYCLRRPVQSGGSVVCGTRVGLRQTTPPRSTPYRFPTRARVLESQLHRTGKSSARRRDWVIRDATATAGLNWSLNPC